MKYLHPFFMLLLLSFLYKIYKTGSESLTINEKSPEADRRDELLDDHKKTAHIVTGLMIPGFIGGVIGMIYFLGNSEIFVKSYGHGFLGAGVLGLMLSNIFVGRAIKKPKKDKARQNLLSFHRGLMYFTLLTSFFSIITGAYILIKGPA
jgi:hypothetical protein